ncbi:uncharacterized protein [Magallana gigas]|uniref:uncharacterized protein n=1 Tax=Magallana gigas TaxID=29159 RepID=UPI00333EA3C5
MSYIPKSVLTMTSASLNMILFACLALVAAAVEEKRILLNDPDLIHSEIAALRHQIQEMNAKQEKFNTEIQKRIQSGGAIFVRWGKHSCPDNDTELVYSGFAGGSYFDHPGAAAEYVCLTRNPVLTSKDHDTQYGYMYGAEYNSNAFGPSNGDDIPCAVCRSLSASSVLMIPGTNACVTGWRRQYKGYLAAGYYAHPAASQYICLDESPETVINGRVNDNGKLVHPVMAVCGALECPPYENGKYLTCVVCTK